MKIGRWRGALVAASVAAGACQKADSLLGPSAVEMPQPVAQGASCGTERWAIKTLSDSDAIRVDFTPIRASVSDLNALPARCSSLPNSRFTAEELRVYEVIATVALVRSEDDRDYHVVLIDEAGSSIVVEFADPACAGAISSPFASTLAQARADFTRLGVGALVGRRVRVRGVGFYDFNHNQTGRSRSCLELHPVLGIDLS